MKLSERAHYKEASSIAFEDGANNTIAVYAHETLRWIRFDDTGIQSVCDLARPWYPVATYCLSMLSALCLRPDPAQVLNLGLGGGTLERFFSKKLPRAKLTSVETCPTVIKLAKQHFELSEEAKIVQSSGQAFVASCTELFDIIFIDMFDENGHLQCLGEKGFYVELASIVTESGLVVIDIAPLDEDHLLSILLAIRPVFDHLQLSTDQESSNMVVVCSRNPFPDLAQTLVRAEKLNATLGIDFSDALQRFSELPIPARTE